MDTTINPFKIMGKIIHHFAKFNNVLRKFGINPEKSVFKIKITCIPLLLVAFLDVSAQMKETAVIPVHNA